MQFTEEESSRLILLRSLEWEALPVFATRGVAPIALFWFSWWQVCLALAACSFPWCLIRTRFVSLRVALVVSSLSNFYVSLLANVLVALAFFVTGRIAAGCVALFWNLISTLLAFAYPPARTPTIQEKLWTQMQESAI